MTSKEFAEWIVYHTKVEPFGEWRRDFRLGKVASALLNIQLTKESTPFKPSDFVLEMKPAPIEASKQSKPQSVEQQKFLLKAFAQAFKQKHKGPRNQKKAKQ